MTHTMPTHWRAIWISDLHLGTAGCNAAHLLDFLKHNDADTIYLVGDIIDGWQLRKNWVWPRTHNDVVQKILRKARKGSRVVFIPGNHDEFARQFVGYAFGDIEVQEDAVHVTADGRRLWVTHGDQFDGVIQHSKWLAHLGDTLYTFTLWLNLHFNRVRRRMGLHYWSLSQYLKHRVKNAVSFITDFEEVLVSEARRQGYDGVVCGHIHKAEMREIDGLLYCNDGDWVESLSALVEDQDGKLQLLFWTDALQHEAAPAKNRRQRALELPALPSAVHACGASQGNEDEADYLDPALPAVSAHPVQPAKSVLPAHQVLPVNPVLPVDPVLAVDPVLPVDPELSACRSRETADA